MTTSESTEPAPPAKGAENAIADEPGQRTVSRRLVFLIVAITVFMSSVDMTIVATALHTIHDSLHATINWAGWTITIYGLGMVVALPISGRLSDQFGRRKVFLYGIAVFTAASLACGFATDVYMLIVLRALQSLGGGALTPSATGLVSDHFGRDRDRAIGLFGTLTAGGQMTGPVLGGLFVGYLSWRWIFFVNVPIGAFVIFMTVRHIPESTLHAKRRTDIRGLALMAVFVLTAIFGITSLGNGHTAFDSPLVIVPEVFALVFAWLFVRHTRTAEDPFIPMRLISKKGFAVVNIENILLGATSFGIATLIPLYAVNRYHLTALGSGTLLTIRALGMIAVGTIATFALRHVGYRLPLLVGFVAIGIGTLLMSFGPQFHMSPYVWLAGSAGIVGLGTGTVSPAARNACLQLAPDDVAAISGLRNMFSYVGIIFAVSVVTAILNRSSTPGITEAHIFWVVVAIIFVIQCPLVYRVPEHRGTW